MRKKNITELEKLDESRKANSKVIALMNNKGGCGKTTTSIALGLHAVRAGYNVLLWDNDPQSNLSQRLGVPEPGFKDVRMDKLFRDMDREDFKEVHMKYPFTINYPYLYKLHENTGDVGNLALVAGSPQAEREAKSAEGRLNGIDMLTFAKKDIYSVYRNMFRWYKQYFDYIIVDTAPTLEGNLLNQLAVKTVDEVIVPIDGLEAAIGFKNLASWIYTENLPVNGGIKLPNVLLAMVKYQADTKNLSGISPDKEKRNAVYRVLKNGLNDFVCENGIKELPSLRNRVYGGFGRKTKYDELCSELMVKLEKPRGNFFEKWNKEIKDKIDSSLYKIEMKTLEKKPEFRTINYMK